MAPGKLFSVIRVEYHGKSPRVSLIYCVLSVVSFNRFPALFIVLLAYNLSLLSFITLKSALLKSNQSLLTLEFTIQFSSLSPPMESSSSAMRRYRPIKFCCNWVFSYLENKN